MAGYQTFHSNRRSQTGHHSQADPITSIGSTILAAFGVFGLAANGMCITALPQSGPLNPLQPAATANEAEETSESKLFLLTHDESRTDSHRGL